MTIITFIFPSPGINPTGGYKVVYEYANCLVKDGYRVNIVYAGSIFWAKKTLFYKVTNCIRYVQRLIKGFSCRSWFPLDKRVKEFFVFSLNYRHVPKSDIYIATSPYTAMYVKDYPVNSNRKYYFIQGYENWGSVTDEILRSTYHYDLNKIVISNWLGEIMKDEGVSFDIVPNGFDFNYFKLSVPIEKKDKYSIVMTYNVIENKGCKYGLAAFNKLKEKYPSIKIILFGSVDLQFDLPDWISYYKSPNKELHNNIYNGSAIFLSTSIQEGWGLTVGEAMICGQAVVCTDNLGHREMVTNGYNGLFCDVKDVETIVDRISLLIDDDKLRYRIAKTGHMSIQKFKIENSYHKFKQVLKLD